MQSHLDYPSDDASDAMPSDAMPSDRWRWCPMVCPAIQWCPRGLLLPLPPPRQSLSHQTTPDTRSSDAAARRRCYLLERNSPKCGNQRDDARGPASYVMPRESASCPPCAPGRLKHFHQITPDTNAPRGCDTICPECAASVCSHCRLPLFALVAMLRLRFRAAIRPVRPRRQPHLDQIRAVACCSFSKPPWIDVTPRCSATT